MSDKHPQWHELAELAGAVPPEQIPMPAGFADRVLARLPARTTQQESQVLFRLVMVGALAASLLVIATGLWSWKSIAAEWNQSPVAIGNVLPLEPIP